MARKPRIRMRYPALNEVEAELGRLKRRHNWYLALRGTVASLMVVAAIAVLIAMLYLPVMRVTGTSMEPNITNGDVLLCVKHSTYKTGDVICFYYNNKILLKRVIGTTGDIIDIDDNGYIYKNKFLVYEPYLRERSRGICDVELPMQISDEQYFVIGDNRATSVDSRSSIIGNVRKEDIIGKVFFRVWPLKGFGRLELSTRQG